MSNDAHENSNIRDDVTGVDTTGHEWDGVRELNNPLPRWWLYVFYITIAYSIGYMVIFPSIPLGKTYFAGTSNYSARHEVEQQIAAAEIAKGDVLQRINASDLADIRGDSEMLAFSITGGSAAFAENCAACHGTGASGGPGYPNLLDDDWLWGGDLESILTTIQYGIRWNQNDNSRFSEMPAYGAMGMLSAEEIKDTAQYVLGLAGLDHDATAAANGAVIYAEQCAACHMDDGSGMQELGAPALNDAVWLYGGTAKEIEIQLHQPRHGVMPSWENRLSPTVIKMLTVYVHELGGGQ